MKNGIDRSNLNEATDPRQNFYEYACGGWKVKHPLEGEYATYGVFSDIALKTKKQIKEIMFGLRDSDRARQRGTIEQKISCLMSLYEDRERLTREGAEPLKPYLERIENFERSEFNTILAWLADGLDSPFFSLGVGPDDADSDINILHIGTAGLGLGDRDYYLEKSENNDRIMKAYREYLVKLMLLTGYDQSSAERIRDNVLEIEHEIAKHRMPKEDARDPFKTYHMMPIEEIRSRWPLIDWQDIFARLGLNGVTRADVVHPEFLDFINSYIPKLSDRQLKDFMIYGIIANSTGLLGDDYFDLDFEMFSRVMNGIEEKRPLWKRVMELPSAIFGEAIGQLYVEKYFPPENKQYMVGLVENLRTALRQHISDLSWMSDETKQKALEKLDTMGVKIGYPDKWKDYSEINIDPALSLQENVMRASQWFMRDSYSKLGKPVEKEKWGMYPQTVNAYYSPIRNEICFPAGILQPPFFDINVDDAQNYGAIGVVIGHEMTHGFDDSGRHFNSRGNLKDWWTKDDEDNFNRLADKLVEQFDAVEVAPGVNANGRFTLGENIADQGGLRVALTAYLNSTSESDRTDIDGFSALQRFYLANGLVWAANIRPEAVLTRTKSDPHSLPVNRINVTLRNIEPFFEAFGVKEGDEMYRSADQRVIIW